MNLNILRNSIIQATMPIDENTVFTQKLMGEHKIDATGILPSPLAVQIGDFIEHNGERFYINAPPSIEKINNFTYIYDIVFEGEIYYLYNKLFMDEGQSDFSYTGDAALFMELLLTNINSTQQGWSFARNTTDEQKTIVFNGDTCRTALTKIIEAFELEFRLEGRVIYIRKSQEIPTLHIFEYGRNNGLYSLTRNSIDDKNLVTRAYGFGATKNIDFDYRNSSKRLVFEDRYKDANVNLYGIREGSIIFEDIFPQRTGTVSAINTQDIFEFTDETMDFNVNENLIEGTTAKVVFKTGALSGYEFEIKRYLNTDKKYIIIPFVEENGYALPNSLNYPEVGDEYTLIDINMPASYVEAAEDNLELRTQEYLDENSVPRVSYSIDIDEKYIRDNAIALKVANLVRIIDPALGLNSLIRVSEVTYPLVNTAKVTAVISDKIPYTVQERLIADTIDNQTLVKNTDIRRAELARRSTSRLRQLQDLVFDADDYFDPGNIKPESIETLMLSVGAKSQNFGLLSVSIQPNALGNPANLNITPGQLVHYEIEIDGLGYIWDISGRTFTNLESTKPYFVYANCSKTSLTGIWELSEVPRVTEEVAGQYLFNLGILYPVENGRRDFDFTNGMTFINGDTITTGQIQSIDGLSYFNLNEGKFKVGDNDYSFDWNVTNPGRLTIKGALLQTVGGQEIIIPNSRGAYVASDIYIKGDVVTYQGDSYQNITESPTQGVIPTNASEWVVFVEGGATGPQGPAGSNGQDGQDGQDGDGGAGIVYRGAHSSTTAYYNNSLRRDVVLRSGIYYIYNGPDGGISSFNSSQWQNFGAQFTSVATDLLLAENANIADWIIKSGRITSQDENSILYGAQGKIHLQGEQYGPYDDKTRLEGDGISVTGGGFPTLQDPTSYNSIGNPNSPTTSGPFATVSGKNPFQGTLSRPRAGVHGLSLFDDDNSFGGLFTSLKVQGDSRLGGSAKTNYLFGRTQLSAVRYGVRRVTSNTSCGETDYLISCNNQSNITVFMPSSPIAGRVILVRVNNNVAVSVNGNGRQIYVTSPTSSSWSIGLHGGMAQLIYDGVYWLYNRVGV